MSMLDNERQSGETKTVLKMLLSRVKTALKGTDAVKRTPFLGSRSSGGDDKLQNAGPSQPTITITKPESSAPSSAELHQATTNTAHQEPPLIKVKLSQIDIDRARRLAERFHITIETLKWRGLAGDRDVYRVEKPIRVRIHRTCHTCDTGFGEHTQCDSCPRFPTNVESGKSKMPSVISRGLALYMEPDNIQSVRDQMLLIRPSYRTDGQALVWKKAMQRVRRTCHECSSMYQPGVRTCTKCGHIRCTDCPSDPVKKRHYPDGYPGDEPSSTSTQPIKYNCHQCTKVYPATPHPSSAGFNPDAAPLRCLRCGHLRCHRCLRAAPMKVDPESDPAVVRSVEARLARFAKEEKVGAEQ